LTRNIEHGLTRVYVENLEGCAGAVQDEVLVEAVGRRVADAEFVGLFARFLGAAPEPVQRALLAPVLVNVALERIDAILEEANAIGRLEPVLHVNCARFGDGLIVLVSADSQHDWVLPAIKSRLRAAWAKLKVDIDPDKIRTVDMAKGEPLKFLGYELRYLVHPKDGPRVVTKRLQALEKREPGKLAQWLSFPFRYAARAVGRFVPSLRWRRRKPSPTPFAQEEPTAWQEACKAFGVALASDWRAVPLLFFYCARYFIKFLGRRWELVALTACAIAAVVLLWQFLR